MARSHKLPTDETVQKVGDTLVNNAFAFLEKAIGEVETHPEFSVAHFATGLELILKYRLFVEHWSLVLSAPHRYPFSALMAGAAKTIQASELVGAISSTCDESLQREHTAFKQVFLHRNQTLHFAPPPDSQSIVQEQLTAWFFLNNLLRNRWSHWFQTHKERIQHLNSRLHKNRAFLNAKFNQIEPTLVGLRKEGRVITCGVCDFTSLALGKEHPSLVSGECRVCGFTDLFLPCDCGQWVDVANRDEWACECGNELDPEVLINELDPDYDYSVGDEGSCHESRAECANCHVGTPSVARWGDKFVCVVCLTDYENTSIATCQWCSTLWAGKDLSDSASIGCGECHGLVGHHMGKDD